MRLRERKEEPREGGEPWEEGDVSGELAGDARDNGGGWIGRRLRLAACGWNLGGDEWLVRLENRGRILDRKGILRWKRSGGGMGQGS